jgi:probable phosphoglycerate mutase
MSTRLILVRHGETPASIDRRFAGSTNVELTEHGHRQAADLAKRLRPIRIDGLFCSPLTRCRQTAAHIQETTGLRVREAPDMRECHFGTWEGLTAQEVAAQHPEDFQSWIGDETFAPPDGECWRDVTERAWAWWEQIATDFKDRTVCAVTHGGPIVCMLRKILQTPYMGLLVMEIDPCSVTLLQTRGNFLRVRVMNDTSHYREILRDPVPPDEVPP